MPISPPLELTPVGAIDIGYKTSASRTAATVSPSRQDPLVSIVLCIHRTISSPMAACHGLPNCQTTPPGRHSVEREVRRAAAAARTEISVRLPVRARIRTGPAMTLKDELPRRCPRPRRTTKLQTQLKPECHRGSMRAQASCEAQGLRAWMSRWGTPE